MIVALVVLAVGAIGLTIALGIEAYTENKEDKKNDKSNSR